jgi:hypothetical protein
LTARSVASGIEAAWFGSSLIFTPEDVTTGRTAAQRSYAAPDAVGPLTEVGVR